jgi:hypothetical protein
LLQEVVTSGNLKAKMGVRGWAVLHWRRKIRMMVCGITRGVWTVGLRTDRQAGEVFMCHN